MAYYLKLIQDKIRMEKLIPEKLEFTWKNVWDIIGQPKNS